MNHQIQFALEEYDRETCKFAIGKKGTDVKIHRTREEVFDLLHLLGETRLWDSLPCACTNPVADHQQEKEEAKQEETPSPATITEEFARHTVAFKAAFWVQVDDRHLAAEPLLLWISQVHPIMCCEKRHKNQAAMLEIDGGVGAHAP